MADAHSDSPAGPNGDDELLVDELRRIVELLDPVPAPVLAAARGSLTWRTIDAELAELVYDSAADAEAAAVVRTAGDRRLLTFESLQLSVELEVTSDALERRLVGQVVPAKRAVIEIRHPGGVVTVDADELGRFAVDGLARGPVSLVCRLATATEPRTIATDWLVI